MAGQDNWVDVGSIEEVRAKPLRALKIGGQELALSCKDDKIGAVSNICNHVGGPLGKGRMEGDYILCPWHSWKFHRCTGLGEPGFEADAVPAFPVREEAGPGDYIYIPASTSHLAANASTTEPLIAIVARTDPNEQESVVLQPELDARVPGS